MRAGNVTRSTPGQGLVIRGLETASLPRSVVVRIPDHSRHIFLGTSHLFGLCSLGHCRITSALRVHLRLIARLGHWRLPIAQGHSAVQMNFGNSYLNRHRTNLISAHHCLGGSCLLGGNRVPSSSCKIPACHTAQRIVNGITRDARRVNLCASGKVVVLTFVSVQTHFLSQRKITLAKADIPNQPRTSGSGGRASACENPGCAAS